MYPFIHFQQNHYVNRTVVWTLSMSGAQYWTILYQCNYKIINVIYGAFLFLIVNKKPVCADHHVTFGGPTYELTSGLLPWCLLWTLNLSALWKNSKRKWRRHSKACSRPHTECASQVWDPHLQKDINQLQRVQKFALCICAIQNSAWDLVYAELLNRFKVLSLGDLRKYLSLCTMYKVVNELVYFPHDDICGSRRLRKSLDYGFWNKWSL